MSLAFRVKKIIALLYDVLGISQRKIKGISKKYHNQYIRVVNYHHVLHREMFIRQLEFYKEHFENINFDDFEAFLNGGKMLKEKPGIMITFDDGFDDNYDIAIECLEKNGFTGWFMVSSDLVDRNGYMTYSQISEMVSKGHVIGCHTATHHRMEVNDTDQMLEYEIRLSKETLEEKIGSEICIFCWCGGEEEHYTTKAARKIKDSNYKYSFMTNSYPVLRDVDPFHIQRINIEDGWPISLVKLQICGFMDKRFGNKRKRVNQKTA